MGDDEVSVKHEASGPSWARTDWPPMPGDDLTAALTGEWPPSPKSKVLAKDQGQGRRGWRCRSDDQIKRAVLDSIRALMIIRAYRIRGHLLLIWIRWACVKPRRTRT
ncbi:Hypothetical protein FKW44_016284 [Caligus rogercresseyi]|uniref:Uncharacterized protein n=1 Tax=Caligus rogercresseyi TaxID=217165 RepID=A0A7T8H1I9_CALRO|nr:Hypothetical protein FKW44_016284 [Caligus rogercresseyi]